MSVIITPTVDSVYKFSFEPRFSSYDGIYRLVKLVTYDQYLEDGGNILTDFYKGCDLQEADVTTDLADLRESKIMMLANASAVTDEISLYAPLCFVKEVPDCNVKKYYKFGMISYIGITDDPTTLDYMKTAFVQHVESALGVTPDPRFMTLKEVWMTDDEYQAELAARDATKKQVVNYYSENQRLQKQLAELKTLLADYETTIIKQQKQLESFKLVSTSTSS